MPDLVVVGSSNTDMVVRVPALPGPGETTLGGDLLQAGGGKGANQAVAAARAGGRAALIAAVGEDVFGADTIRRLAADGVDVSHLQQLPGVPSGVALIVVDAAGENSIVVAPGANAALRPERIRELEPMLAAAAVVVVQLEIPLETVAAAVRIAARGGATVILNPAPGRDLPDNLLADVSVLTPNEGELRLLTGMEVADPAGRDRAVSGLLDRGVEAVVVTLGARGAYLAAAGERALVPGFPVEAMDTTGAGDVFNGALAVALSEGQPLESGVRFACAAAAISVTRPGAQPSAPTRAEIESLLRQRTAP